MKRQDIQDSSSVEKTRLKYQRTLAESISCKGRGLHTGCEVKLTLHPSAANTGIRFRRADLSNFEVPATVEYVARVSYATTLMKLGVMVATVEHLLSALAGCQIDNCVAELNSLEVPILDGSASEFVAMIKAAGIVEQPVPRLYMRILEKVEVEDGNRKISIEPSKDFSVSSTIDFPHHLIGRQHFEYRSDELFYTSQVAPARTFGFEHEIELLRKAGLIRGGSLENAIVVGRDNILNPEPLRFLDEFARHKILDIIGDMALAGWQIIGKLHAERSGHGLHSQLVSHLLRHPETWELVEKEELKVDSVDAVAAFTI